MVLNPYVYGSSVSGSQFFGREAELQQLKEHILEHTVPLSCSIVGETRIGKSSLLKVFKQLVDETQRDDLLCLHYNMSSDFHDLLPEDEKGHAGAGDFYRNFVIKISTDLSTHPEFDHQAAQKAYDPAAPPFSMTSNIGNFFRSIRRAGYWLLLILDGFDAITEHFRFDPNGWKLLRTLGENQDYGLRYLLASRRPIWVLEKDAGISSNLANIFQEDIRLALMPPFEAHELVEKPLQRSGMQWTERESELIEQTGGGHPDCLQMICSSLFRQKEHNLIPPDLDEVQLIQQLQAPYAHFFETLRRRLERSHLFDVLLRIAHGAPVSYEEHQVRELELLGHLCPIEGTRQRFRPFSLALEYYLQAVGRQMKLWPVLAETEAALQLLVERQYQERFGTQWLEEVREKNPAALPGGRTGSHMRFDMVTRWQQNHEQERRNPFVVVDNRARLIQHASIMDLKYLISQQPELFQRIFPWHTYDVLENALTRLYNARDSQKARYRLISDEEAAQTGQACEKLLGLIQPFLEQHTALLPTASNREMPQVGDTIAGQYQIVRLVKKTRHSYVVKAWDTKLERDVAIKFLLNVEGSRESFAIQRARLQREGKLLAPLRHKNLGILYDTIAEPPGAVMAWIEEGPLSLIEMFYNDSEHLPLPTILSIAIQLCDALSYIHDRGIIHRDIKPNNILLDKCNDPILIDFDIARSVQLETVTQNTDGSYRFVGNESYSSPEQFTTPGSITAATDVFSLGVVLYQTLTHRLPFPNANNPDNYQDQQLPRLDQEHIPAAMFAILLTMFHQEPDRRPTARTLRERFAGLFATLTQDDSTNQRM
ncbi:MAG TPA: protein kinase [Ktedonobacteraceae bacterium]|jgi:hypothetical protein